MIMWLVLGIIVVFFVLVGTFTQPIRTALNLLQIGLGLTATVTLGYAWLGDFQSSTAILLGGVLVIAWMVFTFARWRFSAA